MTSGDENKVISFTVDKELINKIYNNQVAINTLGNGLQEYNTNNYQYTTFNNTISLNSNSAVCEPGDVLVNEGHIMLVVGSDDYGKFKLGDKSNKMLRAEELINKGQDLEIITEDDFLELLMS